METSANIPQSCRLGVGFKSLTPHGDGNSRPFNENIFDVFRKVLNLLPLTGMETQEAPLGALLVGIVLNLLPLTGMET